MEVHEAAAILGVHEPLRVEEIRSKYRRAALKCHPDKGGCSEAFHRVCEAHDVLQRAAGLSERAEVTYSALMRDFLTAALGRVRANESRSLTNILDQLASGCKAALGVLTSLRDLDPQTCLTTLTFLEKHAETLHIDAQAIASARAAFSRAQGGKAKSSYTLTATLDHVLAADVFRLRHGEGELMVPLWHEDLVFDTSGGLVCVHCAPALPPHMAIDENGDLHVDVVTTPDTILSSGFLEVELGKDRKIHIPSRDIKLVAHQEIVRPNSGVPAINLEDVYATDRRGDIIVRLKLSLPSP